MFSSKASSVVALKKWTAMTKSGLQNKMLGRAFGNTRKQYRSEPKVLWHIQTMKAPIFFPTKEIPHDLEP